MRVLIISDIHGNYYALKTVIGNIRFDVLVCSGDLVVGYPFPRQCIEVLKMNCSFICMGNHDYAVAYDEKSYGYLPPKYMKYPSALDRAKELTVDLLEEEFIQYLRMLPQEYVFAIDGVTFYINHSVPNLSLNYYLDPKLPQSEIEKHYRDVHADILVTGHTHIPFVRNLKNRILVNPGSVGEPRDGDPRTSFAVFDTRTKQIEFSRLEYDTTETSLMLKQLNFPNYSLFCLKNGFLPEDPDEVLKEGE
jgi:putative phosphoesterase